MAEELLVFMCGRSAVQCAVCGGRAAKACDYPLRGKLSGRTCDRALCSRHAIAAAQGKDLCPAHARVGLPEEVGGG